MRQEKWLLIGLVLLFSACGNKAKDAPTADGGADAQIGGGGAGGGGGADSGGVRGDALPPGDVPITVRSDGGADAPILISGCSSNLECSGRADNAKICSAPTHECVECLTSSDCAPGVDGSVSGKECVKNVCVSHPACINSIDCVGNFKICDRNAGVCVECVANADCGAADQICAAGACRKRCASDIECTPLRLLCEPKLGYCASCVLDTDCPASQFCSQGECLRDTCVPGTTKCQSNAVVTCNAGGGTWVSPVACKTNQSCQDTGSAGVCMDRVCSPSAKTCSSEGEKVMACSADGLTNAVAEDCAASGKVCVAGACAAVACTAGARFCQGLEVRQCSAKGESSTLVSTCTAAQYCDAATTTCKTKLCNANQPTCSGTLATTCDSVGAAPLPGGTDCAAQGLLCSQGKCQAYVCTASSTYCDAGSIYQCSADGFSSTLVKACGASEYCDKGSCKPQVCAAGQPVCSGTNNKVATTCNADGSGYTPGGTDCSLTSQGCLAGVCKDFVCTASTYVCQENELRLCASTGLSYTVSLKCTDTQYCDLASRTCKARVCTPGQPTCSGNVRTTCKADGSGGETGGTACGTNQTCDAGECKAQVCPPSTYVCKDNDVYYCASTGLSSTLYKDCNDTQYCDSVNRLCPARVCTPGAAVCSGNVLTVCKDDGSGPATGGTTCEAGKYCNSGLCKTQVCTPSTYICELNVLRYCDTTGLSSSATTICATSTYCDATARACKPDVCTPGQPTCSANNVFGTCNPDGSGVLAGGTDCTTEGKICSAGACATSAVDTIGTSDYSTYTSTSMKLNVYAVTSTRTLTKIEQYVDPYYSTTLTWVVYSAATTAGPFTRTVVATTTAATGSGYASSDILPTPVALQAGYYYAIGVSWSSSSSFYYYYHSALTAPLPTSFGTLENGYSSTTSTFTYPTAANYYFPQRLNTAP